MILVISVFGLAACGASASEPVDSGDMRLSIELPSPVVGQNRATVVLTDLDGAPLERATVELDPQMPHHGHGSTEVPIVSEIGDGRYDAFPVTFQMPGAWQVTATATLGTLTAREVIDLTVR